MALEPRLLARAELAVDVRRQPAARKDVIEMVSEQVHGDSTRGAVGRIRLPESP